MRGVVEASLEDATGDRCVDLIRGEGWAWAECRRDPEDAHGWRRLHPPRGGYADRAAAEAGARAGVGWLA
ncbi:hypothetical protein JQC91_16635 [Jannaschia sp. Os4]|uniref:hypothetical protein n=1 Tax=Jannaschia sp. Os4 TaxID=2807617 RepID=UPI00193AB395|nr:hypothetical protein [Jannaschia sp. Os4]MBM2577934.1 hypothetical protein [Jannaschia sp. Os4]